MTSLKEIRPDPFLYMVKEVRETFKFHEVVALLNSRKYWVVISALPCTDGKIKWILARYMD